MGVNLIFRIAAVGILVSVICQVLKHSGRDEQAFLTSLASSSGNSFVSTTQEWYRPTGILSGKPQKI